jgi:uncharacterized protein (TIGR02466 family)
MFFSLFPTPVSVVNIERKLSKTELNFAIKNGHKKLTYSNTGNLTSIERYALNNPELNDIRLFIEKQLLVYIDKVLKPKNRVEFFITNSWLNYNKPNDYHHRHYHTNSILSGVFYFVTGEKDSIAFYAPRESEINFEPTHMDFYNHRTFELEAKPGNLIIFPSHLNHSVPKNKSKKTRISLSFNTFCKGTFDTNATTGLVL